MEILLRRSNNMGRRYQLYGGSQQTCAACTTVTSPARQTGTMHIYIYILRIQVSFLLNLFFFSSVCRKYMRIFFCLSGFATHFLFVFLLVNVLTFRHAFGDKSRSFLKKFLDVNARGYNMGDVTPYMHILAMHVGDMLKRLPSIKPFSCQGMLTYRCRRMCFTYTVSYFAISF